MVVGLAPHMSEYVTPRGNLYTEMDMMIYGDKKAGLLWFNVIMKVYTDMGFTINKADPCVIHYTSAKGTVHGAVTVDDTLFVYSSKEVLEEVEAAYVAAFGIDGFTSEKGNEFVHLGMLISQDLDDKSIAVSQNKFVGELMEQAGPMLDKYGYDRGETPADPKIFDEPKDTPFLSEADKEIYRSLNMSLMYAATRTYPECLVAATACAARFTHATEGDMRRLLKAINYMTKDPNHCITIRPASETIVCSADCSYAVHTDGYSHDAIALGFEGVGEVPDAFFVFSSGKQTTIAKSSCHGELTTANVGADYLVWAMQLMEGFGNIGAPARLDRKGSEEVGLDTFDKQEPSPSALRQDNKSTIHLIVMSRGSFKNSKHISVREQFIRDLVRDGESVVRWLHMSMMVADLMSKGVSRKVFRALLPELLGRRRGE